MFSYHKSLYQTDILKNQIKEKNRKHKKLILFSIFLLAFPACFTLSFLIKSAPNVMN